jgi:adenylate kinase
MTHYRSIIETHNDMIKVIPETQCELIADLIKFINTLQKRPQKYLMERHNYVSYLNVLLKHLPNRPLKLSDPDWMWNCQEVFSSSEIIS